MQNNINDPRKSIKNAYLLVFIFFLQVIDNILRENGINSSILSNLKIGLLLFSIFCFLVQLNNKDSVYLFKREILVILLMYIFLLVISLYWMHYSHIYSLSPVTIGFMRIMIPIIFAFLVLNVINFKQIYVSLTIFLIISFIGFILMEIVTGKFSLKTILAFSLTDSTGSTMESNFFSPTAVSLCIFFGYFRKSKWRLFLSVLFTIMTYKRIMTLLALFILFFGGKIKNKRLAVILKVLFGIIFYLITVYYIKLNLGQVNPELIQNIFKMPVNEITMGRTWMFQNIYQHGFEKQGIFTIINSGFRSPEMDLLNIYLEAGSLSVVIVIMSMLLLIRENLYTFLIISFTLVEMLTSHWLDITFFWVVIYITIGCIQYKGIIGEKYGNDKELHGKTKKNGNTL